MSAEAVLGWGLLVLCSEGREMGVGGRDTQRTYHMREQSKGTDAARTQVPLGYPCQEVTIVEEDECLC